MQNMEWPDYAYAWVHEYGKVFTDDILYKSDSGNILKTNDKKKSSQDDIYYSDSEIY